MPDGSDGAVSEIEMLAPTSAREANATIHLLGGTCLDVVQGPNGAGRRIEAAHEAVGRFASLTDTAGKAAFVNPIAVTFLEPRTVPPQRADGDLVAITRDAKARVHFLDGTSLDVLQGISIVNKRFEESRGSAGLFAYLMQQSGRPAYVSRLAITHITADPH